MKIYYERMGEQAMKTLFFSESGFPAASGLNCSNDDRGRKAAPTIRLFAFVYSRVFL